MMASSLFPAFFSKKKKKVRFKGVKDNEKVPDARQTLIKRQKAVIETIPRPEKPENTEENFAIANAVDGCIRSLLKINNFDSVFVSGFLRTLASTYRRMLEEELTVLPNENRFYVILFEIIETALLANPKNELALAESALIKQNYIKGHLESALSKFNIPVQADLKQSKQLLNNPKEFLRSFIDDHFDQFDEFYSEKLPIVLPLLIKRLAYEFRMGDFLKMRYKDEPRSQKQLAKAFEDIVDEYKEFLNDDKIPTKTRCNIL